MSGERRGLLCQECKGHGREVVETIFGWPRHELCGWGNGTGEVTPEVRGLWLREQRKAVAAAATQTRKRPRSGETEGACGGSRHPDCSGLRGVWPSAPEAAIIPDSRQKR